MNYIREGDTTRQATVESLTEVVFAGLENAALERMSLACQLHFTRALVRNLAERLEFANLRISQTAG